MKHSPFAFFRKHQRVGMVALTVMAMFAFVFLDSSFTRNSWFSGTGYADSVAVNVKGSNLTRQMLAGLVGQRSFVNRFIAEAIVAIRSEDEKNKPNEQQLSFEIRRNLFGVEWSANPDSEDAVMWSHIMRLEARRMGLRVTDPMVESYIKRFTEQKLTPAMYQRILKESGIRERALYDAFQEEILARMAWQLCRPMSDQTPEQYWEHYRKMKVRQNLELAALPVKSFTADIEAPAKSVLQSFFNQHKAFYPETGIDPSRPGFRQPDKVRLQYMTISYESLEKSAPVPTEEDILAYYESKKDSLYRDLSEPEDKLEVKPGTEPAKDPEGGEKAKEESAEKGKTEPPASEKTESTDKSESPKAEEAKPTAEKPAAKTGDVSEKTDSPVEKKEDLPSEKKPEPAEEKKGGCEDPSTKEEPAKEASVKPADKKDVAETKETPAETAVDKSVDAPLAEKKAGESEKNTETTPSTLPPPPEPPAEEKIDKAPVKYKPLTDLLKQQIRDGLLKERTEEARKKLADEATRKLNESDPSLKFNLPMSIDGQNVYLDENEDGVRDPNELTFETTERLDPDDLSKAPPAVVAEFNAKIRAEAAALMKKVAKELKMTYSATELLAADEVDDKPGIGKVIDLGDNPFQQGGATRLLENVFVKDQNYQIRAGRDPESEDLVIYWRSENVKAHIPRFEDPGIEELVLEAWKLKEAYPIALKRAEELVKVAGKKPLEESLKGIRVAGKNSGPVLEVRQTPDFSWMSPGTPSPNSFGDTPPRLSTVEFTENIDETFMQVACQDLGIGEVGYAPNRDHSIVYVIRVINRDPKPGEETQRMRETFMKESTLFGMFNGMIPSAYTHIAQQEDSKLYSEWMEGLRQRYQISWNEELRN